MSGKGFGAVKQRRGPTTCEAVERSFNILFFNSKKRILTHLLIEVDKSTLSRFLNLIWYAPVLMWVAGTVYCICLQSSRALWTLSSQKCMTFPGHNGTSNVGWTARLSVAFRAFVVAGTSVTLGNTGTTSWDSADRMPLESGSWKEVSLWCLSPGLTRRFPLWTWTPGGGAGTVSLVPLTVFRIKEDDQNVRDNYLSF